MPNRTKVLPPKAKNSGDLHPPRIRQIYAVSDVLHTRRLGIWLRLILFSAFLSLSTQPKVPQNRTSKSLCISPRTLYSFSIPPLFLLLPLPPPCRRHRKVARRHLRRMPTPSRDIPRALERAPTNTGSKTQTQTRRTRLGSPVPCRTMDTPQNRSEPRTLLARLVGAVVEAAGAGAVNFSMMSPPVVQWIKTTGKSIVHILTPAEGG